MAYPPPSVGDDPIVNFEVAVETIMMIIGWLKHKKRSELQRAEPDQTLVAYLDKEVYRWLSVKRSLSPDDQEGMARLVAEYGPILRTFYGRT